MCELVAHTSRVHRTNKIYFSQNKLVNEDGLIRKINRQEEDEKKLIFNIK